MDPDFITLLDIGGERAVADMVVAAVEENPGSFRALFDLCFVEQYPLSMRASRALLLYCEKYHEAIYPYLDEAVGKTLDSTISGVRRNFLKIFAEYTDIGKISDPGPLLNTCFDWMLEAGNPPGIKIHAMTVIYKLGLKEPELLPELAATIEIIMAEGEPSIRAAGRKMLGRIRREERKTVGQM